MEYVIAYVDGGYHLNLTAIPSDSKKPQLNLANVRQYQDMATDSFNEVVTSFRELLHVLEPQDIQRPMMQKQNLSNPATMNIL